MSFAYLPLYTGDYLRDTRHLSPLRHGVYLLLLMHCWDQKGPLPLDEQEIAGIANCRSADEIDALRYVVSRFFVQMEDGWYNKRIQTEIERAEVISRERSVAGRKGYEARAKQLPSKSQASASTPTPIPILSPTLTPKKVKSEARATRLPADWELPEEWKTWAIEAYRMEPQRVVRIALDFKRYWVPKPKDAAKLDWKMTWQRWVAKEMKDA